MMGHVYGFTMRWRMIECTGRKKKKNGVVTIGHYGGGCRVVQGLARSSA